MISKHKTGLIISLVVFVVLFFVSYKLSRLISDDAVIKTWIATYGYFVAIFVSFITGFKFIVPVPTITFLPIFVSAGLSPLLIALLLAVGTSLAYIVEYAESRKLLKNIQNKEALSWERRIIHWKQKHPALPILFLFLYFSFVPLPSELTLPIATAHYRNTTVLTTAFLGHCVYNIFYGTWILILFRTL